MKPIKWYKREIANRNILTYGLLLLIVFLFAEVMARIHDWYRVIPWIDVVTHFFAGAAFFILIYWWVVVRTREERVFISTVYMFFLGIIWELLEVLEEEIYGEVFPHLQDTFIWDGFFDIIVNMIGAYFSYVLFKYIKKKTDWFSCTEL